MIAVVIPTIREADIQRFLRAWEHQLKGNLVIVVEDNPEKSYRLERGYDFHVSWKEIDRDLGDKAWIISRRSAAVRSYGFLLAAREGADVIWTLDDDCYPQVVNTAQAHEGALLSPGSSVPCYDTLSSLHYSILARGFPSSLPAHTMINHGLWNGVPDLDGKTQTEVGALTVDFPYHSIQVPVGTLFPMSSMNLAFRRQALPLMYMARMGQGQPYNRYDDIWCGWIAKRICDHMKWGVRSGAPFVYHSRASNAEKNRELEATGLAENDRIFELIRTAPVSGDNVTDALMWLYDGIIGNAEGEAKDYWAKSRKAHFIWSELCKE